jgi:hypothetical protein
MGGQSGWNPARVSISLENILWEAYIYGKLTREYIMWGNQVQRHFEGLRHFSFVKAKAKAKGVDCDDCDCPFEGCLLSLSLVAQCSSC